MVAITNTTLVAVVTQSRILYGMAREDVVPGVFAKIHPSAAARGSAWSSASSWSAPCWSWATLLTEAGAGSTWWPGSRP